MYVRNYYVDGYLNVSNGVYPRKDFNTSGHNNRNLAFTKKYVKQLETHNQDLIFNNITYNIGNVLSNTINKQTELPNYIYRVKFNGKHIRYEIIRYKTKDGKSIYKKYNDSKIPLKDKYIMNLKYLENLLKETTT